MTKYLLFLLGIIGALCFSCNKEKHNFDASGFFEAKEILISSEVSGKILSLNIEEGDTLSAGKIVGNIDCTQLDLQKAQMDESMKSISSKTLNPSANIGVLKNQITNQKKQIAVFESQLLNLNRDQKRIEKLVQAEASPAKALDDINGQIDVVNKQLEAANNSIQITQAQINAQVQNTQTQNNAILSEQLPMQKRIDQFADLTSKCKITNPIQGTILTKYAEVYELAVPGKALYKIANLAELTLRCYVAGDQLSSIQLGQDIKVKVDAADNQMKDYTGKIIWISDKAEFTPKTIQTKSERQHLVYAMKVKVINDGYLKIGMYGEVYFK